jgi:hypothetical protein
MWSTDVVMHRRVVTLLLVGLVLLGTGSSRARAIETEEFGIDVVAGTPDRRLHIPIKAGQTSKAELRVWNKGQSPLRLEITAVPARVDAGGSVALGGDDEAAKWVKVDPSSVELPAGVEQRIDVRVAAPRRISGKTRTIAVLASPAQTPSLAAPGVLQRLAVTTYLEPDEDSLIASLGALPWIAGIVLLAVAVVLARRWAQGRQPT